MAVNGQPQPGDLLSEALALGDVHLWFLPEDALAREKLCQDGHGLLSSDERARFESMANPVRAQRYRLGRILLRQALASHLGCDPGTLAFGRGAEGKLILEHPRQAGIDFCLSHSRRETVLAVVRASGVGIDVEPFSRAPEVLKIARRFYPDDERRHIEARGERAASEALALWTLKEAAVKAIGSTIWRGLSGVPVEIAGRRIEWHAPPPRGNAGDWQLALGEFRRGHRLALALWQPDGGDAIAWHQHIFGQPAGGADQFEITAASVF